MKTIEKKVMKIIDNYVVVLVSGSFLFICLSLTALILTVIKHGAHVFLFLIFGLLSYVFIKELVKVIKICRIIEEKKEDKKTKKVKK